MRPPTAASLALALCLAGALLLPTVAAAPTAGRSRRLLGPAVPEASAGASKSAYAPNAPAGAGISGSSSAVGAWHGLSVAASKNTAGVAAAASNNWDFDKDTNGEGDYTDGDDNDAIPTGPAPKGFYAKRAAAAAAPQAPPPTPVAAPAPKATASPATLPAAPKAAQKPPALSQAGRR